MARLKIYDGAGWVYVDAGAPFSDSEGDPAPIGAAADGSSIYAARRDHVHAGARSLDVGTSADPNTTAETYILTNHAHSPDSAFYWHIFTQFYSSQANGSNCAQLAYQYNASGADSHRVYARHYYVTLEGWTGWKLLWSSNDLDYATAASDFLIGAATGKWGKKTLLETQTILQIAPTNFVVGGFSRAMEMYSGADTVLGHNCYSDAASRILKKTNASWYSSWIRMYYNKGIRFGVHNTLGNAGDAVCTPGGTENEHLGINNDGTVELLRGQLLFPATQNASADVNTLDDYEEGTWTPQIYTDGVMGTLAYTLQYGTYVKIGRQVTLNAYIVFTKGTATGAMYISGLPFSNATYYPAASYWGFGLNSGAILEGYVSGALVVLMKDHNAAQVLPADCSASTSIMFSATMFV